MTEIMNAKKVQSFPMFKLNAKDLKDFIFKLYI